MVFVSLIIPQGISSVNDMSYKLWVIGYELVSVEIECLSADIESQHHIVVGEDIILQFVEVGISSREG